MSTSVTGRRLHPSVAALVPFVAMAATVLFADFRGHGGRAVLVVVAASAATAFGLTALVRRRRSHRPPQDAQPVGDLA